MSQKLLALSDANEKRTARAQLKQRARAGDIAFVELCASKPAVMNPVRIADVVAWGWPKLGTVRQERLGKLAAAEGINMLLRLGSATDGTRRWLCQAVAEVRNESDAAVAQLAADEECDDKTVRRLMRAETERDLALQRVEELERQVRGRQFVMPTVVAESSAADLVAAIDEHRATITNKKSPPERWATADEALWAARDRIAPAQKKAA